MSFSQQDFDQDYKIARHAMLNGFLSKEAIKDWIRQHGAELLQHKLRDEKFMERWWARKAKERTNFRGEMLAMYAQDILDGEDDE